MYARVAAATGWTWEYIGQQLTLPRLYAMYDHWRKYPPVAESVAAYLGIKPQTPQQQSHAQDDWFDSLPETRMTRPILHG